jgi:pimeloyl-ACP methyl ester carboxylesterase
MGESSDTKRGWLRKALKWISCLAGALAAALGLALLFFHWQASQRETESITRSAPGTGHLVRANDVEIFLQQAGPDSGGPVLLVHGTGAWSEIWRETISALAEHGYHPLAMDVPPFGFSEKPHGALAYSRESQARRIIGLLDTLGIQRATLVGHSVGARPVIEAALEMPDKSFSGLSMCNGPPLSPGTTLAPSV